MLPAPQPAPAAPAPPGPAPSAPSAPSVDLEAVLLSVVADKTGYPVDMLDPDMELEADLGVDSIKRVEILAAMRTRTPDLPEVETAVLGKLRTLRQIVDQLRGVTVPPASPAADQPARTAPAPSAAAAPSVPPSAGTA